MQSTPTPAADGLTTTQASTAYQRLRYDLLSGRLEPLRKLQMRFLTDLYDTGQTPLREALNRLSAEGLVENRDQRGFYVAGISETELVELTKTRCWVERIGLTETIKAANAAWEEELVLAHHRLSRVPRSLHPERFESNPDWERLHATFHHSLISGCGSRPLIAFCQQLADRFYRYRQLSIRKVFTTRPVSDEHRAILDAVLDRDGDRACDLLEKHYWLTAESVRSEMPKAAYASERASTSARASFGS